VTGHEPRTIFPGGSWDCAMPLFKRTIACALAAAAVALMLDVAGCKDLTGPPNYTWGPGAGGGGTRG
jgi:hypothetical protein